MDMNTIQELLIAILPSVTAICGVIFTAIKIGVIKHINEK